MLQVVVFDTNVLLSAIGWGGTPHRCLELARTGLAVGLTCAEIMDELAGKLRNRLRLSEEDVTDTITDLLTFLEPVVISNTLKVVAADRDDDKILECAVVGGATHLVTGDRRHLLPLGSYQGVSIVTPAHFLSLVSTYSPPAT